MSPGGRRVYRLEEPDDCSVDGSSGNLAKTDRQRWPTSTVSSKATKMTAFGNSAMSAAWSPIFFGDWPNCKEMARDPRVISFHTLWKSVT